MVENFAGGFPLREGECNMTGLVRCAGMSGVPSTVGGGLAHGPSSRPYKPLVVTDSGVQESRVDVSTPRTEFGSLDSQAELSLGVGGKGWRVQEHPEVVRVSVGRKRQGKTKKRKGWDGCESLLEGFNYDLKIVPLCVTCLSQLKKRSKIKEIHYCN